MQIREDISYACCECSMSLEEIEFLKDESILYLHHPETENCVNSDGYFGIQVESWEAEREDMQDIIEFESEDGTTYEFEGLPLEVDPEETIQ